jgi:predicted metal-dependent enzyme (double-stranded beta helix superfamily)
VRREFFLEGTDIVNNIDHFRFLAFLNKLDTLIATSGSEAAILDKGSSLLGELIETDDWLPDGYAASDATHYRQYLLHADPDGRFSIVSFVWGPGQKTPIHNHTVWGLIGMLRGAEYSQGYRKLEDGSLVEDGEPVLLNEGDVDAVSPEIGDLHAVSNAFQDRTSISIHVYGADIGKVQRSVFRLDGTTKDFVSGYSNA